MSMNRIQSHLLEVDLIGKLADLKDNHYQHVVALGAIIELLIEKGLITQEEIERKMSSQH